MFLRAKLSKVEVDFLDLVAHFSFHFQKWPKEQQQDSSICFVWLWRLLWSAAVVCSFCNMKINVWQLTLINYGPILYLISRPRISLSSQTNFGGCWRLPLKKVRAIPTLETPCSMRRSHSILIKLNTGRESSNQ